MEEMDENRTPNVREPDEHLTSSEHVLVYKHLTACGQPTAAYSLVPAAGSKQTSDPLGALVPMVLAGATCVVAKLFHKQHKQQKDFQHKQSMPSMLAAIIRRPKASRQFWRL